MCVGEVKLKYQGDLDDLTKSFPRSDGSADLETELSSLLDENTSFSSKLAYLLRYVAGGRILSHPDGNISSSIGSMHVLILQFDVPC